MLKDSDPSNVDAAKSKPTLRPDLSQSMSTSGDSDRILTSLKSPQFHTSKSSSARKISFFALTFLLIVAAGAAFAGYRYWASQANNRADVVKNAQAGSGSVSTANSKGEEKLAAAPLAAPAPSETVQAAAATQAAQIVNEAPVQKDPAPAATSEAKLTDALEKDVKPPKATLQKALESKPKSPARVDQAVGSKSTPQKPVPTAVDKDINLIAALLAHNAANPASSKQGTAKPSTATTKDVQLKNGNSGGPANATAAVTRNDVTESALKQCESFDFLQREVCKFRTCDKQWETNPVCKATLSSAR